MKLLYNLLFVVAVFICADALGQTKYETVQKTFRITYIYPSTTNARDTALGYFAETNKCGLEAGASGVVTSLNSNGYYTLEIGNGFVVTSDSNGTFVYITSNQKALTDSQYVLKVGDLITLNVRVPRVEKKSIFYELELTGTRFYRRDNTPLYTFEDLISKEGKQNTESLLTECLKECKDSYEALKAKKDLGAVYYEPISAGRHKGKSIMDVLKDIKPNDLLPFLTYAREKNIYYRGQQYFLYYRFVLWLNKESPYSSVEMLDTLLSYNPNSTKFAQFAKEYKKFIVDNGFVKNWAFMAMNKESDKEADAILAVTAAISNLLDDGYSKALHFLAQAQIYQYRKKYKEAITAVDSGLKYIKPQEYGHYYIELLIKKAVCLQRLSMLKEAVGVYDVAVSTASAPSFDTGYATRNSFLGRIYNLKGDTYKAFDEFINAAEAYRKSIKAYKADGTYTSLSNTADVQSSLAGIYKSQGAYADAYDIYSELTETYSQLFDVKSRANTYDNLGYVQFKQGKYREAIENHGYAKKTFSALKLHSKAAFSLSQIGQAYWNLGNYDSAIISHDMAIENAKLGQSPSDEAYSWSKLGSLYNLVGDKNKALNAYDSSLFYYEAAEDSSGLLTNLNDVGGVYEKDGQYQKAFGYYNRANKVYLKQNDKAELVNSYFRLAYAAYNFDTAIARKNYLLCYNLAKELGDKSNILYSSLNLGVLATRQYNYTLAEKFYQEGLALSIEQKSKTDEAWAYTKIADGSTQKLEYQQAIELYSKALHIYDSLGERSQAPNLYSSIGYATECKGDFTGSLRYFEKMKDMGFELKNMAYVASALNSMSFVYSLFGDHQRALASADSALQIFKDLNNNWQIANSYITMGAVHSGMGDFQKAVSYYLMSDSLFKIEKDDISRSNTQNNLGVVYFFQADYDKSLGYFMEADKLAKVQNTVNEGILITRQNIGEIYLAKKNYELATKYLMDVNKISREKGLQRMLGGSSLLLGKVAFENNRFQEALTYFKEARETSKITNESDRIIEANLFLGKTYDELKDDQAINYLRSSVALAQKTRSKYLWQTLYELGISYYNKNNYDSAIIFFKDAVTTVEESASKLFGGAEAKKTYAADEKKVDLYNKLVASLAKLNKPEEALYYADKSNNQAIKEKLEQSGIVTADKDKSEALKKGNELLQKQTAIEQTIAKEKAKPEKERNNELIASLESVKKIAEEDYLNFIDQLVKTYPDMQSYFSKTNPADFKNYLEYIPDSTIAVLYVINDNQLYIFTATNQQTAIRVVELKEDINKQATRLLSILKNPENATGTGVLKVRATIRDKNVIKGDFKTESAALYNLLIMPIADQLKDKKTLCIIPNSKLSSIPFEVLGNYDAAKQFHLLVEDYGMFYTNKMDIFLKPFKPLDTKGSFTAFGNPDSSLPGASTEVKNIYRRFPSAIIFLEKDATETRAKESIKNSSIVHFATHGVLDYEDFSKSYLLFNRDDINDGKFTIAEVNGMIKKSNEMVFLSACEMAVQQETVKGWYVSPANAFLNNRVNTVVSPLWQVPDEATTMLLDYFYENVDVKKMSRTEALRQAQASLSKDPRFTHPYFWAAFVLYGEWR